MIMLSTFGTVLFSIFMCSSGESLGENSCPLWHVRSNGMCRCGFSLNGDINCVEDKITVATGYCMTLDNITNFVGVSRCLYTFNFSYLCQEHKPFIKYYFTNLTGPELNHQTCKIYNREGSHCRQCIHGYGPAAFSDGVTCADCSKHKHLWALNLIFQLTMVAFMYLIVILFQLKGSACPLNVIITYSQLFVNAIADGSALRAKLECLMGGQFTAVFVTLLGIWNLDFCRFIIPPLCISTSFKSINTILFDYVVAFFPLVLTLLIYVCIELHDKNVRIIVCSSIPLKKFFKLCHNNWNPKTTILNTCVTFLLLAYSKFLFVSINLLLAVQFYNSSGAVVPNSIVLLYDTEIQFLHSRHIPYVVLSSFVLVFFVLLPPVLLLLYPTRMFRKCLSCCGFQRWDMLQLIADVFQGWYKDGTEGTLDYRALSTLYLLLRLIFGATFVSLLTNTSHFWQTRMYIIGISHIFLGMFFLIVRPYKKKWMSDVDGLIISNVGVVLLLGTFDNQRSHLLLGVIVGITVVVCISLRCVYAYFKDHKIHFDSKRLRVEQVTVTA